LIVPATLSNVTIDGSKTILERAAGEGGVALCISRGTNITIKGLTAQNAQGDGATAGFGIMAGSCTLVNCKGFNNPENVRTGKGAIIVREKGCIWGPTKYAGQLPHSHYIDYIDEFSADECQFLGANGGGHVLKSRAKKNTVTNSTLAEQDTSCSRLVDFTFGGDNLIENCVLEFGRKTDNADMMGFAREGGITYSDGTKGPDYGGVTTVRNCTVIVDWNDPQYTPGPHWAAVRIVTLGGLSTHKAVVQNLKIVKPGGEWRVQITDDWETKVTDLGGHAWFESRAAAGLQPYPSLV
jgi:hypothetical protein